MDLQETTVLKLVGGKQGRQRRKQQRLFLLPSKIVFLSTSQHPAHSETALILLPSRDSITPPSPKLCNGEHTQQAKGKRRNDIPNVPSTKISTQTTDSNNIFVNTNGIREGPKKRKKEVLIVECEDTNKADTWRWSVCMLQLPQFRLVSTLFSHGKKLGWPYIQWPQLH